MLVRESIDFVRGRDSKEALNLGIEARIVHWMEEVGLNSRYEMREYSDGEIKIYYLGQLDFKNILDKEGKLPEYINFGTAFSLTARNLGLEELPSGSPKTINGISTGYVHASGNNLKSFRNFPVEIGRTLDVRSNFELNSLEGFPKLVNGDFNAWDTPLMRIGEKSLRREIEKLGSEIKGEINT